MLVKNYNWDNNKKNINIIFKILDVEKEIMHINIDFIHIFSNLKNLFVK